MSRMRLSFDAVTQPESLPTDDSAGLYFRHFVFHFSIIKFCKPQRNDCSCESNWSSIIN